jgi:hypothetical protein
LARSRRRVVEVLTLIALVTIIAVSGLGFFRKLRD